MLAMPDDEAPQPTVTSILAFDFGLRRIGVAVGQTVTGSASPLGVVDNTQDGPDHDRIAALLREWRPDRIVVGMPYRAGGHTGDIGAAIGSFIEQLAVHGLPVETIDESLSSHEAEATLKAARQRGSRGRIRKEDIDAAAAVQIAERYIATLR